MCSSTYGIVSVNVGTNFVALFVAFLCFPCDVYPQYCTSRILKMDIVPFERKFVFLYTRLATLLTQWYQILTTKIYLIKMTKSTRVLRSPPLSTKRITFWANIYANTFCLFLTNSSQNIFTITFEAPCLSSKCLNIYEKRCVDFTVQGVLFFFSVFIREQWEHHQ